MLPPLDSRQQRQQQRPLQPRSPVLQKQAHCQPPTAHQHHNRQLLQQQERNLCRSSLSTRPSSCKRHSRALVQRVLLVQQLQA